MADPGRSRRSPWSALVLVLVSGCYASHGLDGPLPDPSHPTRDAGRSDGAPAAIDAGASIVDPDLAVCGGHFCAAGEECCLLTATCVALTDPSCAVPPGTTDPEGCVRPSDCAPGELCNVVDSDTQPACGGGVGRCMPESECGSGSGAFCGCDGRTYAAPCDAWRLGVRIAGAGGDCGSEMNGLTVFMCASDAECDAHTDHSHCDEALGHCIAEDPLVTCGLDAQCPDGQRCCGYTGRCFDPADPVTCTVPESSFYACGDVTDCDRWSGRWWRGHDRFLYCDTDACGAPGACRDIPSHCDGAVVPVCGCDGTTYTNECEAHRAATSVAHTGACDEA